MHSRELFRAESFKLIRPYTPQDAYYIDSKIDDGVSVTGRVTAAGAESYDLPLFIVPSEGYFYGGVCSVAGPPYSGGLTMDTCDYDLTVKEKYLGLFIGASF